MALLFGIVLFSLPLVVALVNGIQLFSVPGDDPQTFLGAVLTFEPVVMAPLWFALATRITRTNVVTPQNVWVSAISVLPSCIVLLCMAGLSLRYVARDTWRGIILLMGGATLRVSNTFVLTIASSMYTDVQPWTTIAYITAGCGLLFPTFYAVMARTLCSTRRSMLGRMDS